MKDYIGSACRVSCEQRAGGAGVTCQAGQIRRCATELLRGKVQKV
jgi:hypothetical protein